MITAKIAQTLDGKIATASGDSKWITSAATRLFARKKRNKFDAIVVGINTVLKDDPLLTPAKPKKGFKRIILDSTLKLPLKAKVIRSGKPEDCIVVTTRKSAEVRRKRLEKLGVTVWVAPSSREGGVNLKWMSEKFKKESLDKVLIEGGAAVVSGAIRANIVDQLHCYIAPKIVGDSTALSGLTGFNVKSIAKAKQIKIKKIQQINQDIFIKANVYRNR